MEIERERERGGGTEKRRRRIHGVSTGVKGGFSNNSRPRIFFHPEPKETHVAETESQSWIKRERKREREGHLTDICDDIREDCLNGKEGGGLCVCSLAKCIESSLLEWIFIRTSSEPTRTGPGIRGILTCWHAAMSAGWFFFSFFSSKRRILPSGKMVFGLETTVCSFREVILKVVSRGKFGIMMGVDSFLRVPTLKRFRGWKRLF